MNRKSLREPNPELEDIRELGLLTHQHRKAARALGVSHTIMSAIWIIAGVLVAAALVALALAMR